ncbi:MAG: hypothetical protein U0270_04620 [Labilithrix sp.]
MKASRGRLVAAAVAFVAALFSAPVVRAEEAVRVVIAGPKKDPIAARLEKELVALGFAPVAVGALPDCTGPAITSAVQNAGASAALCSNSGRVAVWTDDGHELKLRDTIVARDAHGAETMAMQAAVVMRATIAFREPEPVGPPPATAEPPPPSGGWEDFENEDRAPSKPKPLAARAPRLTFGAGASYLVSRGASLGGLSLHGSVGLHRYFSLSLHVDAPLNGTRATPMTTAAPADGSHVRIAPGLAGVGLEIPFTPPSAFVIPRLGANVGAAWVHATKTPGSLSDQFGEFLVTTEEVGDTIFAPAGWLSAAFSFHVGGPLRVVADGLVGATAGGIVIRNQGVPVTRYGVPLASVGLRAELVLP